MRPIVHRLIAATLTAALLSLVAIPGWFGPLAFAGPDVPPPPPPPSKLRHVSFTYQVTLPNLDQSAKHLDLWLPMPRQDSHQTVTDLRIQSPLRHRIVALKRFGNRAVYFSADAPLPASVTVSMTFHVVRREWAANLQRARAGKSEPTDGALAPELQANTLVPTTGKIEQVAMQVVPANATPFQQARSIYDYVVKVMKYNENSKGGGHGDALWVCDHHEGVCTDFHSLFVALARSRGIPAQFIFGFPLDKIGAETIDGYHCWAEFYSGGVWVPVDASEAWLAPKYHDFYFGHLDADRVAFTQGRDLELVPPQHGKPLNYFIYPYAELDGQPLIGDQVKLTTSYRDLGQSR